ncbi:hypothetical protein JCM8202_005408 [Rhodotorula sphaerocarpa]
MAYLAPGQGSGSSSSSSANKENALFHSVIASSAAPAPYAAHANPLAQSHSQYYHRPLPPSPSKTTATAVPYHVRPQPPLQHHPSAAPPTRGLPPSASAPSLAAYADDPTIAQLLAAQGRPAGAGGSAFHYPHSHATNGGPRDLTMGNATGLVSWRKGQGFKEWEKVKLESAEVKRKADVAQLYFYDHYFDLLTYLSARKTRLGALKASLASRAATSTLSPSDAASAWSAHRAEEHAALRKRRTKLRLEMFHIVTQVGQGGYGEVYLARHKETQQVVALKKMKKRTLAKMDEIRHVLTERDILASTSSPWLVRLLYAFQDAEHVFLAMDFIAGGDFRTLLNNSGVLKEEHARFYISEMFCAVAELHKLGYIHRDLKPENFLIDTTGHIKLTDFGLAAGALNPGKIEHMKHKLNEAADSPLVFRSTLERKSIYKTLRLADARYADSVVGSPDYMAIETLRGQSYSYSVDYWSLGCILFEFLAGYPPFSGATPDETWNNLKNWHRALRRPHYDRPEDLIFNLSDDGWSAITCLIASKERRMSTLERVQSHPFFRGVDWEHLRERTAPFIPALDSEVDAGYFDDFSSESDMAKYAEVREKQRHVEAVAERGVADPGLARGVWVGFTFRAKKDAERAFREQQAANEQDESLHTLF